MYTTRPDTLFGATYLVLAPEHPLVDAITAPAWPLGTEQSWTGGRATPGEAVADYRLAASRKSDLDRQENRDKTGVFTGAYAANPATNALLPVFVADYVLMGYGTGAIMAVPGQDTRDWDFAKAFDLPIIRTVQPTADHDEGTAFTGEGLAINSSNGEVSLDGMGVAEAKATMIAWLTEKGLGRAHVQYKLRDWLFSRQRYWGEPFPIVYDDDDVAIGLPDEYLPLELPEVADYSPKTFDPNDSQSTPLPPLARATEWASVELDLGDGPKVYRRELNVMPQWAGSCWYELRYLDPTNEKTFCDPDVERYWMGKDPARPNDTGGVDLYVGGVEHAVLHLLYSRFWHKVLFDLGHVSSEEPFRRLFNQGYIQAYAYTDARGVYVNAEKVVETTPGTYVFEEYRCPRVREDGEVAEQRGDPDIMCEMYGADTFRMYEMSMGPLDESRPWQTRDVVGAQRYLQRLWRLVVDEHTGEVMVADAEPDEETRKVLHRTVDGVRDRLRPDGVQHRDRQVDRVGEPPDEVGPAAPRSVMEAVVLMTAPLAPHIAEELWSRLGHDQTLTYHAFPEADPALLVEDAVEYPIQVRGKVRSHVVVAADADTTTIEAAALADPRIVELLAGVPPRKIVVVPGPDGLDRP